MVTRDEVSKARAQALHINRIANKIRHKAKICEGTKVQGKGQSPFSRIKVVECGEGFAAAFAAKQLADIGAEVIKVEPPGGDLVRQRGPFPGDKSDPEKSGSFIYLNTNKRGVVADLKRNEGRELLAGLLERADILLHNVPPTERAEYGLESGRLCAAHPKLVATSISIFGDSGPYANWRGYELTAVNAGGWAFLSPGASPYPDKPPLKCFGHQAAFQGGMHAAFLSLAAYLNRLKSGKGQAIEVSEQEVIAGILEMNFMHWTYTGRETSRLGNRALGPWFIADCADGKIFAFAVEEDQWQRLVEFMGDPEWAHYDLFKDRVSRGQNLDALKALMTEWFSQWKVTELYREAQKRRIPFAPVYTMQQLYENEQLLDRGYFATVDQPGVGKLRVPGMPSKYSTIPWSIRRPAPRLGEHSREVFCGELGLSNERFAKLHQADVA